MRALLSVCLTLGAACATTPKPTPEPVTPLVGPPATFAEPTCPTAMPEAADDLASVRSARVEKVCLVGASADAYLRLHEIVAPREGSALSLLDVREDLEALFASHIVHDARAIAQPLPSKGVVLSYFVREYDFISKVSLEGASSAPAELVRELSQPGKRATAAERERLRRALLTWYSEAGFTHASAVVDSKHVGTSDSEVTLTVTEGARLMLHALKVVGTKKVPATEVVKALRSKIGAPFQEDALELDLMLATNVFYDRGFVQVSVDKQVDELASPAGAVDVTFNVKEGELFKLGKLSLTGFALSSADDIVKKLESKKGLVFSRAMLKRDIDRIVELAKRAGVHVEVLPLTTIDADKHVIDVAFELEKKAGAIQF